MIGRLGELIYRLNNRLIILLLLILPASMFVGSRTFPTVRAAGFTGTGLVCITASSTATNCSNTVPSIGPFTLGSTFTVGVFINNSQAMGGFDIYVKSDPTFLSPTGAALGPLIVTPSLTSICVNGSAQTGACTTNTANGPGVAEVTTIESSGSNECGGVSPCSGMAFTINYTVVGATSTPTALAYPTAAGCSTSSVSSPPNTCVLVDNSVGTTLPENIQAATVAITLPSAVVCIVYPSTATSCLVGAPNIPVTSGLTFTVGVFIQGSQPLAGFDIYVSVDTNYLIPTNATLGSLISSPSLTSICINGATATGSCTVNTANRPGVVEVSTVESSGGNECLSAPCSGLAFTISFKVVGKTSSSSLFYPTAAGCSNTSAASPPSSPNECVLLADAFGITLPESLQGAFVTQSVFRDSTSIAKTCGSPVVVGQLSRCTATVTDTNATAPSSPIGAVTWTSDGSGSFNPNVCTLSAIGPNNSGCTVFYMPSLVGTGTHHVGAIYVGDPAHSGSTGPSFNLNVTKATARIFTAVIVDQTGRPVPASGIPVGVPVHDVVIFLGGFPVTGAPGTVTYTLFPNSGCTAGTGTVVSTVNVDASDSVKSSTSTAPNPAGSYSFNAFYSGDSNNNAVTSACEPFTVTPAPSFTNPHWTHHLSLSKTSNTQGWTVTVDNPLSSAVNVVIRIVGGSAINPSLTFDVTCGVTCVNTVGGVNFTPGLTPVSLAAGAKISFSFNQPISGSFANQKVTFTATLYWATGTLYTRGNPRSGSFAVVP